MLQSPSELQWDRVILPLRPCHLWHLWVLGAVCSLDIRPPWETHPWDLRTVDATFTTSRTAAQCPHVRNPTRPAFVQSSRLHSKTLVRVFITLVFCKNQYHMDKNKLRGQLKLWPLLMLPFTIAVTALSACVAVPEKRSFSSPLGAKTSFPSPLSLGTVFPTSLISKNL